MPNSVDSLSLDFEASSSLAEKSIDNLTETLEELVASTNRLKSSFKGMGLDHVAKDFESVRQSAARVSNLSSAAKEVENLAKQYEKLGMAQRAAEIREGFGNPAVAEANARRKEAEAEKAAEAAKVFADGEKEMKRQIAAVERAEAQKKRDADLAAFRQRMEAERQRHNIEMENLKAEQIANQQKNFAIKEAERKKREAARETWQELQMEIKAQEAAEKEAARVAKEEAKAKEKAEKEAMKQAALAAKETERRMAQAKKSLAGFAEKFDAPIDKVKQFANAIKRIALYRAIRSAIKGITNATKEGLTNLKEYSTTVGTAFAPAVDNLRQHVLMLKNAFATALRPVIEAIIPIIIRLVDWLSKAADFIAQVLSVLTGKVDSQGRYTKAVLGDLQESNKEAKALQRTLLGFDEINRLDGDSGSSSSAQTGGLQFEQAEVSEKAKEWAERLQKIIDKIKEIAKAVKKIIQDNPWILELAGYILGAWAAAKLLGGAFKTVLSVVKLLLNPLTLILAFLVASALYGDKIKKWVGDAKEKVDGFFDGLKGHSATLDAVIQLAQDIFDFLSENLGLLSGAIYKLVHGDVEGAVADLKEIGWNIVRFVLTILLDIVNIILGVVEDIMYAGAMAWRWLHNKVFAPAINWIVTKFYNGKIMLHNAWIDIEIGIVKAWRWIWSFLKEKFGDIIDSINDLIAWMNKVFGTDIDPIEFDTNTTNLDAKIEELEKMKLDPLTETVEVVGQWKEPERLKLKIDTSAVDWAMTQLGYKAQGVLNKLSQITTTWTSSSGHLKKEWNIEYASGGFPAVGSMFIAGEAGAEWVGNIGGRTGVMNTEQMAAAMYNAMSAALANNPQGGDIYLDGEVIYRNTVRRNNNHVRAVGRSALLT